MTTFWTDRTNNQIHRDPITLLFFQYDEKQHWDPVYIQMLQTEPWRVGWERKYDKYYYLMVPGNPLPLRETSLIDATDEYHPEVTNTYVDSNATINTEYVQNLEHPIPEKWKNVLYQKGRKYLLTKMKSAELPKYVLKWPIKVKWDERSEMYWSIPKTLMDDGGVLSVYLLRNQVYVDKQTEKTFLMDEGVDSQEWVPRNNVVVGYIHCSYDKYKDTLIIDDVKIRREFRGQGLCTQLMGYLVRNLKQRGFKKLSLVNAGGVWACRCYLRAGLASGYHMTAHRGEERQVMEEGFCGTNSHLYEYDFELP